MRTGRVIHLVALVVGFVVLVPAARAATTITLSAAQDTTILGEDPDASDGAGPVVFAGRTNRSGGQLRRAPIRFDVAAAIPASAIIESASLTLNVTREPGTPPTAGTLHRLLVSWGEAGSSNSTGNGAPAEPNDATWTHRFYPGAGSSALTWAIAGGDFAPTASATSTFGATGTPATWSSTSALVADVQTWLDQPTQNFGWIIRGDEAVVGSATQFASRENPSAALRPQLTLTYALPAPSADVPLLPWPATVILIALILEVGRRFLRPRAPVV